MIICSCLSFHRASFAFNEMNFSIESISIEDSDEENTIGNSLYFLYFILQERELYCHRII